MVDVELYSRENIEAYFRWRDDSALEQFPDEIDCVERANDYARSRPRQNWL
jgi:hypothetical protein